MSRGRAGALAFALALRKPLEFSLPQLAQIDGCEGDAAPPAGQRASHPRGEDRRAQERGDGPAQRSVDRHVAGGGTASPRARGAR